MSYPSAGQDADRSLRLLAAAIAGVLVIQFVIAVAAQMHLYSDGSHYLYMMMARPRPTDFDWARRFAHLVVQLPPVLAIRAGVTDVGILSRVQGVGFYLPHLASLALCAWIARGRLDLLIWPLLSLAAITSSGTFFILSEGHVLVALFWPLVLLLTFRREWTTALAALTVAIAVPALLAYESVIFLGPVLVGLSLARAANAGRAGRRREKAVSIALALYFGFGIALAVWRVLHPRDAANLDLFLGSTIFFVNGTGAVHLPGILSVVTIGLVPVILFKRELQRIYVHATFGSLVVAAVVVGLSPWIWPHTVAPELHARARVLTAYVPPILALFLLFAVRKPPPIHRLQPAYWVVALLAVTQLAWHSGAATLWTNYLSVFRQELQTRRGLVPYGESVLSRRQVNGKPLAAMNADWTMPLMSIVLSPGGDVRAMIANPPVPRWEPFDPAQPERLADLSRYGIRYEEYRAALGRSARSVPIQPDVRQK